MENITEENRKQLRHLIDLVWNHVHEDESVPSTMLADELIDKAFEISEESQLNQIIEDAKSLKIRLVRRHEFEKASNMRDIEKFYIEKLEELLKSKEK